MTPERTRELLEANSDKQARKLFDKWGEEACKAAEATVQ